MGKIQVHSITGDNRGFVTLNERGNEADGIVLYKLIDKEHCGIYYVEAEKGHEEERDQMIKSAFVDIIRSEKIPIPTCQQAKDWYERERMRIEQIQKELPQEETNFAIK